jgi:hypothetical protein
VSSPELVINGQVETIAPGESRVIPGAAWLCGPVGGYWFPEAASVTVVCETREPDFEDHGDPPPEERPNVAPQTFLSILFDHGADPANAAYACVYFPKADAADMPGRVEEFRARASFERGEAAHAFLWGGYTGLAFFEPGTVLGHKADRACFVAVEDERQVLRRVAVFEPSFADCELGLDLPFALTSGSLPEGWRSEGSTVLVPCTAGTQTEAVLSVIR